jgi:hypothetical protein
MIRPLLVSAVLALGAITALPAAATGHGCQTVQFPRGAYAHAVQGYANSHVSQCHYLSVRPGQQARIRILYGSVFFSTTHTQGNFTDASFYTQNGQLYVYVHTDYAGQQPYTIQFEFY